MTYASECARAASASESRFRISVPIAPARAARVIALDRAAEDVMRRIAGSPWAHARFFTCQGRPVQEDLALRELDGAEFELHDVLMTTDVVIVIATGDSGKEWAAVIGRACGAGAITTAGVVLGDGFEADEAVAALRPHARVLLLSADEADLTELLTALRV